MEINLTVPEKLPDYLKPIEELFPTPAGVKSGEVGVEIEVEGAGLPLEIPSYWSVHREDSLRGESKEYVLTKPVLRKSVLHMLQYLEKKLEQAGARIFESSRTSVHVHINCQGMTLKQIYTFIVLYLIFEDILVSFAGETRVGNVFCLRAKDAEHFIDMLRDAISTDNYRNFGNHEAFRYSSINVCSLPKFNSLEFRAFRGTVKSDLINEWVSLLLQLKDISLKFESPVEIIKKFSLLGPRNFVKDYFSGEFYTKIVRYPTFTDAIMQSVRLVQEVAFSCKWVSLNKDTVTRLFQDKKKEYQGLDWQGGNVRFRGQPNRINADAVLQNAFAGNLWGNPAVQVRVNDPVPQAPEPAPAQEPIEIRLEDFPIPEPRPHPRESQVDFFRRWAHWEDARVHWFAEARQANRLPQRVDPR